MRYLGIRFCLAYGCACLFACVLVLGLPAHGAPATPEWPVVANERPLSLPDNFNCSAWSPDGRRIAVVEADPSGLDKTCNRIWLVDADKGMDGSKRFLCQVPRRGFTDVVWPAGNYLYIVRNRMWDLNLWGSLYRVRLADGKIDEIMRWPRSVVIWAEEVSRDGRYLAWDTGGAVEIVDLAAARKSRKAIYHWRPHGGGGISWSPDGKRLVFGRDENICIISDTGKGLKTVCRDASHPRWSPDGRWIFFLRDTSEGRTSSGLEINPRVHAWAVRPDGSGQHPLLPDLTQESHHVTCSPSGDRLLYSRTEYREGTCPDRWFVATLRPGRT